MKQYKLDIITADKTVTFNVMEPEFDDERSVGLSNLNELPEQSGMIYFDRYPDFYGYPCWPAKMSTKDTVFPVDFLFIDGCGNITKIDKNVPALSDEIHTGTNVVSVLEINAGDCDKYGIEVGDSIIHKEHGIYPGNKIKFFDVMFDKITERTISKINAEDIVFFAIAEGGAMGWAGAVQIMTKNESGIGLFFIDRTGYSSISVIEELFPPLKKSNLGLRYDRLKDNNWVVVNMGFGNHLYVRRDYLDSFFDNLERQELYRNWLRVALKILNKG